MDHASLALLCWSLPHDSERRLPWSIKGCSLLAKFLRSSRLAEGRLATHKLTHGGHLCLPLPSQGEASLLRGGSKGDPLRTLPGREGRGPAQECCCIHLTQSGSSQSQIVWPQLGQTQNMQFQLQSGFVHLLGLAKPGFELGVQRFIGCSAGWQELHVMTRQSCQSLYVVEKPAEPLRGTGSEEHLAHGPVRPRHFPVHL